MTLTPFVRGQTPDPAWDLDKKPTNYRLKNQDEVTLQRATKGDFSSGYFLVPEGTVGVVITARTPRVRMSAGDASHYFANVDVMVDGVKGRIRVPHSALKVTRNRQALSA
jgi:hypothetical protein